MEKDYVNIIGSFSILCVQQYAGAIFSIQDKPYVKSLTIKKSLLISDKLENNLLISNIENNKIIDTSKQNFTIDIKSVELIIDFNNDNNEINVVD